jgi:hypothetical protein
MSHFVIQVTYHKVGKKSAACNTHSTSATFGPPGLFTSCIFCQGISGSRTVTYSSLLRLLPRDIWLELTWLFTIHYFDSDALSKIVQKISSL